MLKFPCTKTLHGITCELSNQYEHDAFLGAFSSVENKKNKTFHLVTSAAERFAALSPEGRAKATARYFDRSA